MLIVLAGGCISTINIKLLENICGEDIVGIEISEYKMIKWLKLKQKSVSHKCIMYI